MPTTYDRLRDILVRDYSLQPDAIAPETRLENLGVDSLGIAELLFTIEDEFKVTVSRDPVPLVTVADVGSYIDGLIAEKNGAEPGTAAGLPVDTGGAATAPLPTSVVTPEPAASVTEPQH